MKRDYYTRSEGIVTFTIALLKRLKSGRTDSLTQRIKSQKMQYLLQEAGLSTKYTYSLYLLGPYSPGLAQDLYKFEKEKKKTAPTVKYTSQILEDKFLKFKVFVTDLTTRDLELLATYHWLIKIAHLSIAQAKTKLKELKVPTKEELEKLEILMREYEDVSKA